MTNPRGSNGPLRADMALAARFLSRMGEIGRTEPGYTRDAYGAGEGQAHDAFREIAGELGLRLDCDAAGNLYATLDGRDEEAPAWVTGSHLDTVPHGGNFDGAAGVAASLAAVSALKGAGIVPRRKVVVLVTRAEESTWFPVSYIGSRTALGLLPPELLTARRADTGRTLGEHMAENGFDPSRVARGEGGLSPDRIHGFAEIHIEQGPILEAAARPLGIVTAISGSFRYREGVCRGAYAHSGAVPRSGRADAVLATSELVVAMDRVSAAFEEEGAFLRLTFGQFGTDPAEHAFSKVAGEVRFCLDVRSDDEAVLERVHAALLREVAEIEGRRGVAFDLGPRTGSTPARMDAALQARLVEIAEDEAIPFLSMPSGAGHDAATFAGAGIASAMLFVRNQNGSHNPCEAMRLEDFEPVATVLTHLLAD